MKCNKIGVALLATGLLLTGCSTSVKTVDGQDVVVSLTDKNLFADDILNNMLIQYSGNNSYFEGIMNQVINVSWPVTSAMEIEADSLIDEIRIAYDSNYGKNADSELLSALNYSGFNSLEEYRLSLIESIQYIEFLNEYIQNNFEVVFNDYYNYANPRSISLIKISVGDTSELTEEEEEYLNEIKDEIENADDFGDLALDYSNDYTARNKGRLGIIDNLTSTDTYGKDFMEAALSLTEGEITEEPIESDGYLYFIKCESTSEDVLTEELKSLGTDSPLVSYDPYLLYLIYQSYEVEFHDDFTKKIVEKIVDLQLEKRIELREENNDE